MADATHVPTAGFNVPGLPALPAAADQAPGHVQQGAGGFTQAQMDANSAAAVAAALAAAKPAPAAADAPAAVPTQATPITTTADDALIDSYTEAFMAIGQGVDMERALGKALQHGNADLIDIAYLAEKGGANAGRLSTIAKAIVQRVQTKATETTTAVHTAAGGQDAWNAASAAFNQNAEPHLKAVVIKMLESGDSASAQAGAKLVVDFAQNGGFTVKPAGMVQAGVAGGSPAQALDKEGFQSEIRKLDRGSSSYEAQYDALVARRRQGKQLGR